MLAPVIFMSTDATKPTYKKRFGFLLLCALPFYSSCRIFETLQFPNQETLGEALRRSGEYGLLVELGPASMSALTPILEEQLSYLVPKCILVACFLCWTAFCVVLLRYPKFTTEKGHFWKLFLGMFLAMSLYIVSITVYQCNNMGIFSRLAAEVSTNDMTLASLWDLNPARIFSSLVRAILLHAFFSFIGAHILTLDEERDDHYNFLKFLKPYKMIKQHLPSFYSRYQANVVPAN